MFIEDLFDINTTELEGLKQRFQRAGLITIIVMCLCKLCAVMPATALLCLLGCLATVWLPVNAPKR